MGMDWDDACLCIWMRAIAGVSSSVLYEMEYTWSRACICTHNAPVAPLHSHMDIRV